jgi:hypothetical protein
MPIIQVDLKGFDEVGAALRAMMTATPRAVNYRLRDAAQQFVQILSDESPVGQRRNQPELRFPTPLKDSYFIQKMGPFDYAVNTSEYYKFTFVTQGTRPHIIEPRIKKWLWWPGVPPGTKIMIVHHPGNQPNRFDERAYNRFLTEARVPQEIADDILTAFQSAFKGSSVESLL